MRTTLNIENNAHTDGVARDGCDGCDGGDGGGGGGGVGWGGVLGTPHTRNKGARDTGSIYLTPYKLYGA